MKNLLKGDLGYADIVRKRDGGDEAAFSRVK